MKHRYQVTQVVAPQGHDSSFKVGLCTMVVLLALFGIFGLSSLFPWKSYNQNTTSSSKTDPDSSSLAGQLPQKTTTTTTTGSSLRVSKHDTTIHEYTTIEKTSHQPSTEAATTEIFVNTNPDSSSLAGQLPQKTTTTTTTGSSLSVSKDDTTTHKYTPFEIEASHQPSTEAATTEILVNTDPDSSSSAGYIPQTTITTGSSLTISKDRTTHKYTTIEMKVSHQSSTEAPTVEREVETPSTTPFAHPEKQDAETKTHVSHSVGSTTQIPPIKKQSFIFRIATKRPFPQHHSTTERLKIRNETTDQASTDHLTEHTPSEITKLTPNFIINNLSVSTPYSSNFESTTADRDENAKKNTFETTLEGSTDTFLNAGMFHTNSSSKAATLQNTYEESELSLTLSAVTTESSQRNKSVLEIVNKINKELEPSNLLLNTEETYKSTTAQEGSDVESEDVQMVAIHLGNLVQSLVNTTPVVLPTSRSTKVDSSTRSSSSQHHRRESKIDTPVSTITATTTMYSAMTETTSTTAAMKDGVMIVPACPTCTALTCPACPVVMCPMVPKTATPLTTAIPVDNVCKTSQCYTTASRILSLVNVSIDPCEDFYSYACGGLLNTPTLLEDDPAVDVWNRIEISSVVVLEAVKNVSSRSPGSHQKLRNYFNGCVNYDKLVTMEERKTQGRKVLDGIAKFADISSIVENDFTALLISLFQHGSAPLFDLQLDVHSANSSKFQVVVTIPDWLSSHFLTPEEKSQHCRFNTWDDLPHNLEEAFDAYKNCMANFSDFIDTTQKALEFFEVFDYMPAYNASQLIQEIRMSIEFDILELLKELPPPDVAQKSIQSKTYKLIPRIQLEAELPQVSWSYLFSTLLNVEMTDATNVQVYFMDYLKKMFAILESKSIRTVQNSLLAIFAHNVYTNIVQTHHSCGRERYCLRVASNLMPLVTSNMYLGTFPVDTEHKLRTQVVLVYQQLETAMESKLSAANWFDEKTLNQITKKLKFMSIQMPTMFNDSLLNASLGECSLDGKQYLEDTLCLLRQYQTLLYSRFTLDPHSADAMWPHFLTAYSTNTAFIYGLNTFMIPMAVIAPVYDEQIPKHVVMATLGNVLARGIGHNFDHTGVKFVAGGKIGMMLSEATNPTYEAVVETSNLQFSWTKSYKEHGHDYLYLLDPELTLNERLSDISAANLSLSTILHQNDTLLPWLPFSSKQVYFLALAQSFCSKKKMPEIFTSLYEGTSLPPFDRVFNMATNSEQFALAFQCPQGSNMNMISELKTRPFPLFEKFEPFMMEVS